MTTLGLAFSTCVLVPKLANFLIKTKPLVTLTPQSLHRVNILSAPETEKWLNFLILKHSISWTGEMVVMRMSETYTRWDAMQMISVNPFWYVFSCIQKKTIYVMLKLINFIVLYKYTLLLNLMPEKGSKESWARGMFTNVLPHPFFLPALIWELRTQVLKVKFCLTLSWNTTSVGACKELLIIHHAALINLAYTILHNLLSALKRISLYPSPLFSISAL